MTGYAATARLTSGPVLPGSTIRPVVLDADASGIAWIDAEFESGVPAPDPVVSLDDRIHYLRQAWAQMTFFLLDPESWR